MTPQYYNAMVRDFVLLCKMFVQSLWLRDHDSSKQKVKTIDIENIYSSIDYGFKNNFSTLTTLKESNFSEYLIDFS